jgi:hypothetical protein
MRDWAIARRQRTRHLIELGGLVVKAGIVDLTNDDRATILGALLEIADQLRNGTATSDPIDLLPLWRRRGLHAFDADPETAKKKGRTV